MIELMISIVISTFVCVALYGVFTTHSRSLMTQDLRMEMHQNGRFAMEILSRSLRMAGFGTSNGLVYGAMGYGGDSNSLPVVISYDADGSNGQDAITVVYMEPGLVMDTDYGSLEGCGTSTVTFNPQHLDNGVKVRMFKEGDLLMCQDYAAIGSVETYLWTITENAQSSSPFGTIYVDDTVSSLTDYSSVCPSGSNLTPVMRCSKGQVITFYIDDEDDQYGPGSPEHPVLMMDLNMNYPNNDDVPLVDNIEDMQFQYCVDAGDDSTNCNMLSKWTHEITTSDLINLWGIRISLGIRSNKDDYQDTFDGERPGIANNSAGSSSDYYFRSFMSSEVAVRNLRLLSTK